MSQVFAAINHRLSEEYAKIDLPSQEAKDRFVLIASDPASFCQLSLTHRLLCCCVAYLSLFPRHVVRLLKDARFLQHELSGLKDINMSNTMLETVVQEKPVRRKSPFAARRASAMVSSSPAGDASSSSLLSVVSSDRTPRTSITGPEDSSTSLLLSSEPVTTVNTAPTEAPSSNMLQAELPPSRPVGGSEKHANGGFREVIDTESTAEKEEEPAPVPPAKDSPNLGLETNAAPTSHE
jgi:vacuolar protein sorting-associated protein 54